jgi:hypothetical protein
MAISWLTMIESAGWGCILKSVSKPHLLKSVSANLSVVMSVTKIPGRLIITNRDIMNILGVTHRTAQRKAREVREAYGKSSYDYITIEEFCTVFKLNEERVREYMLY